MRHRKHKTFACASLLLCLAVQADVVVTQGTGFGVDISPADGRIALDVMGSVWTLPARGGQATQQTDGLVSASTPRWSPDGKSIIYQVRAAGGAEIWQLDIGSGNAQQISNPDFHDQNASWHPKGERIVFSSERNNSGLDIWETDLPTGLSWRLTDRSGDESEPAWSKNGRHLAYVHRSSDHFALVLRRLGEPEQDLVVSSSPLSSPSWRPDGSLLTYLRHGEDGPTLEMVILSDPPLVRTLASGEDFFPAPVSWRDRTRLYYTADGVIKTRHFEDRRSRPLPFRAVVKSNEQVAPRTVTNRELVVSNPPQGPLVIRGARLFDGIWNGYREKMDVLIEGGQVIAVEQRRDWQDVQVLDIGDVTVMPGLIDSWSAAPMAVEDGPVMLAYGVTTIVTDAGDTDFDRSIWEDEDMPGPRLLPAATVTADSVVNDNPDVFLVKLDPTDASVETNSGAVESWRNQGVPIVAENWAIGRQIGADILLGADVLPSAAGSGRRRQYGNASPVLDAIPAILITGLADAGTPGIAALLESRQARAFDEITRPARRIAQPPELAATASLIVAGSRPNGMNPGLALHAELRALQSAGLSGEEALHAAGKNAASMLGLDNQIGTITPGAMADLILVSGDPLDNVSDLLNIVAVVRNGRFFSLISLLERSEEVADVE